MKFDRINSECFLHQCNWSVEYGPDYFKEYQFRYDTNIGQRLNKFRKSYVECFSTDGDILDYGTGYGGLVTSDPLNRWYGFDINPLTADRLGSRFSEDWQSFPNISFFDVLEHFEDPRPMLKEIKTGVRLFITIPLWNGDWNTKDGLRDWKHWRPGEHYLYASCYGFEKMMEDESFQLIDKNQIETSLGREDSYTFAYQKC